MRRFTGIALLVLGLFLIGAPVSGQVKKAKDIPGTGDKDKKDKDSKKDAAGKYPTEIEGKDLDAWVKAIRDPDPAIRQAAMRTVPHFGPAARKKAAANIIYTASRDADVGLRVDAANTLGLMGVEESDMTKAIGALTTLLGDPQRTVVVNAAYSLGRFGFQAKSATPSLCRALQDHNSWEVRKAAAFALGHVAWDKTKGTDSQAVTALCKVLYDPLHGSDPCVPVRLEAINALSHLGFPLQQSVVAAEKRALEDRMNKDRDKSVAIWARVLLMLLDESTYLNAKGLNSLAEYLLDEDARVRSHAAQALGRIGPKAQSKVPDLLEIAKEDKDNQVALVALSALGNMEDSKAIPTLVKVLKDKDAAIALRIQAALSIGNLRSFGKDGLPALIEMLSSKDREMAIGAMAGLAQMGETAKPALADLKKLVSHKDEGISKSAEEAIRLLTLEPKDKDPKAKKK